MWRGIRDWRAREAALLVLGAIEDRLCHPRVSFSMENTGELGFGGSEFLGRVLLIVAQEGEEGVPNGRVVDGAG